MITVPGLKMVGVGAGSLALNAPGNEFTSAALELSGAERPKVLIVGTAEPSIEWFEEFRRDATDRFTHLGAHVVNLHDFGQAPTRTESEEKIGEADVIWVAGGDTLHMLDFWRQNGIDADMGKAAARGTVMSGGSAGMLAWMKKGHSDSMSYRVEEGQPWEPILIDGLGYLAVTACPHFDSPFNGDELRETDFVNRFIADDTLPEPALGIDNMAALVINDGEHKVVTATNDEYPRAGIFVLTKSENGIEQVRLDSPVDFAPLSFG